MYLLCFGLIHGHALQGAPARLHAEPLMFKTLAAAQTYAQPQIF